AGELDREDLCALVGEVDQLDGVQRRPVGVRLLLLAREVHHPLPRQRAGDVQPGGVDRQLHSGASLCCEGARPRLCPRRGTAVGWWGRSGSRDWTCHYASERSALHGGPFVLPGTFSLPNNHPPSLLRSSAYTQSVVYAEWRCQGGCGRMTLTEPT